MRLFLPQSLGPDEPTTPPFLTDREEDMRLTLLRESTQVVREGRHRLPTPEKTAIMKLSTSFEKRRLGKQQQILSEISQRCREQEVNDLSCKISAKCDLKTHGSGMHANPARDNPFYSTTTNPHRGSKHKLSDTMPESLSEPGNVSPDGGKRVNSDKAYKFFPARRIMRQQTKLSNLPQPSPRGSNPSMSKHKPSDTYFSTYKSPRYRESNRYNVDFDHPRRFAKVSTKADPLAPLILPRLSLVDTGYQDRIDSYFSANPILSIPRPKTFYDTASISGRSIKSLVNFTNQTLRQNNISKYGLKTDRSDNVLMNIPFQHDDDHHSLESVGRAFGPSVDNLTN